MFRFFYERDYDTTAIIDSIENKLADRIMDRFFSERDYDTTAIIDSIENKLVDRLHNSVRRSDNK